MALIVVAMRSGVKNSFKTILRRGISVRGKQLNIRQVREVIDLDPVSVQPESDAVTYEIFTDEDVFMPDNERQGLSREVEQYLKGIIAGLEHETVSESSTNDAGRFGRIAES